MGNPKRRKNSSISSSPGTRPPLRDAAFSRVRIFTTDGPTWSTRSVKSGKVRTCAATGVIGNTAAEAAKAIAPANATEFNFFQSIKIIMDLS
jgi:hypothetical protein